MEEGNQKEFEEWLDSQAYENFSDLGHKFDLEDNFRSNENFRYEYIACHLQHIQGKKSVGESWNVPFFNAPIEDIKQETVDYWLRRAKTTGNLVLRIRYINILLDQHINFDFRIPSREDLIMLYAETLIDLMKDIINSTENNFQHIDSEIAIEVYRCVSLELREKAIFDKLASGYLEFEKIRGRDILPGTWGCSCKIFLLDEENRKYLDKSLKSQIEMEVKRRYESVHEAYKTNTNEHMVDSATKDFINSLSFYETNNQAIEKVIEEYFSLLDQQEKLEDMPKQLARSHYTQLKINFLSSLVCNKKSSIKNRIMSLNEEKLKIKTPNEELNTHKIAVTVPQADVGEIEKRIEGLKNVSEAAEYIQMELFLTKKRAKKMARENISPLLQHVTRINLGSNGLFLNSPTTDEDKFLDYTRENILWTAHIFFLYYAKPFFKRFTTEEIREYITSELSFCHHIEKEVIVDLVKVLNGEKETLFSTDLITRFEFIFRDIAEKCGLDVFKLNAKKRECKDLSVNLKNIGELDPVWGDIVFFYETILTKDFGFQLRHFKAHGMDEYLPPARVTAFLLFMILLSIRSTFIIKNAENGGSPQE